MTDITVRALEITPVRGRRQSVDEQQLREDLVRLVNETVDAAIRGQVEQRILDHEERLHSLDWWKGMYTRIGETIGAAIVDHEERFHQRAPGQVLDAIRRDPLLRLQLREALGVD